jgi:hypothetical protein
MGSWCSSAGNAEPLENGSRAGLGRVAVEALHRLLQVVEAVSVELGPGGGGGQEFFLLHHGIVELAVPHERHAQDRLLVVEELVLAKHPQARALGDGHAPLGGLDVARQDAEEGGLSRAVRADQTVALAGVELEGGPLEEDVLAVGLGQVRNRDHGRASR